MQAATALIDSDDGHGDPVVILRPEALWLLFSGPDGMTDGFLSGLLRAGFRLYTGPGADLDRFGPDPGRSGDYTATLHSRTGRHHLVITDRDGDMLYDGGLPDGPQTAAWAAAAHHCGYLGVIVGTDPDPRAIVDNHHVFERGTVTWLDAAIHAGHAVAAAVPLAVR